MAQTTRILILGDSLSAGYGIEVDQSWPVLLQQKLRQQRLIQQDLAAEQRDIEVINVSTSGQTSVEGLAQIEYLLTSHNPDLLVLELGANDGLRGLPLSEMKRNLSTIIQIAQQKQTQVLLLGMRVPTNYGRRYTQMFHESFLSLAKEHQVPIVPFMLSPLFNQDGLVDPDFIQDDGLHPTAKAQPLIMEFLWEEIEVVLTER